MVTGQIDFLEDKIELETRKKTEVKDMEIINGILLLLALALVWGAVNLERPAVSKVEINQSDQMNESMNFLKRLKRPTAW